MADLSVTASSVVPQAGATIKSGTAGEAISAGELVYLNTTTNTIDLADANALASAAVVGIAVCSAATGQPVSFVSAGPVALGSILTAGAVYVLSSTAGGLAPVADLSSTEYTSIIGVASSATVLNVKINNTGALTA